jgi:hypothetical protein
MTTAMIMDEQMQKTNNQLVQSHREVHDPKSWFNAVNLRKLLGFDSYVTA